jgi:hypothetical protein
MDVSVENSERGSRRQVRRSRLSIECDVGMGESAEMDYGDGLDGRHRD